MALILGGVLVVVLAGAWAMGYSPVTLFKNGVAWLKAWWASHSA